MAICFRGRKVNLSHVFAGQSVGVTQVGERIWLVTFMQYDLGYFDDETCRLETRMDLRESGGPSRTRTCDLLVRSQTLYPTELWAPEAGQNLRS